MPRALRQIRPKKMLTITGFHAIEEKIKSLEKSNSDKKSVAILLYDKAGPRAKKIIASAQSAKIECRQVPTVQLNKAVSHLNELARDHRGIVLQIEEESENISNIIESENLAAFLKEKERETKSRRSLVMILDGITDPHNVGAIIRSCDQFGCELVVIPTRRSATESEIIARSSSGAASWVPLMFVPNLNRTIDILKENGYWIYGADAGGENLTNFASSSNSEQSKEKQNALPDKIAIVMGSEGSGMSHLVRENCDKIISIPTCGKLDSLNVSVAAGIILYEFSK